MNMNPHGDASNAIPPVPKRPLTSFNLFSILERRYILQQECQKSDVTQHSPMNKNNRSHSNCDPYGAIRPLRYRDLVLSPDWYIVGANRKKRGEHKNHGLISFQDLSKTLSARWQTADDEIKAYCKKIADGELDKYRSQQEEYKQMYGEDVFAAQMKSSHKRQKSNNDHVNNFTAYSSRGGMVGVESRSNVYSNSSQIQLQAMPLIQNQAMIQSNLQTSLNPSSGISSSTGSNGLARTNQYLARLQAILDSNNSTRAGLQEMSFVQDQLTNQQHRTNPQIPFTELNRNNDHVHTNPYSNSANLLSILDSDPAHAHNHLPESFNQAMIRQNFTNQYASSNPSLSAGLSIGNNGLANLGFSGPTNLHPTSSIQQGLVLNSIDYDNCNRQGSNSNANLRASSFGGPTTLPSTASIQQGVALDSINHSNRHLQGLSSNADLRASASSFRGPTTLPDTATIQQDLAVNGIGHDNRRRQEVSQYLPASNANNAILPNERSSVNLNSFRDSNFGETYEPKDSTRHQFGTTNNRRATVNSFTNLRTSSSSADISSISGNNELDHAHHANASQYWNANFHASGVSDSTNLPTSISIPQGLAFNSIDRDNSHRQELPGLSAFNANTSNAQNRSDNVGNLTSISIPQGLAFNSIDRDNSHRQELPGLSAFNANTSNAQNRSDNVGNLHNFRSSNLDNVAYASNFANESNLLARQYYSGASSRNSIGFSNVNSTRPSMQDFGDDMAVFYENKAAAATDLLRDTSLGGLFAASEGESIYSHDNNSSSKSGSTGKGNSPQPNNFVDTSRGRNSLESSNVNSTSASLQEFGQDVASLNDNDDALATTDLF